MCSIDNRHLNYQSPRKLITTRTYHPRNNRKRRYPLSNNNTLEPPIKKCKLSTTVRTKIKYNRNVTLNSTSEPISISNTNVSAYLNTVNVKFKLFGEQFHEQKFKSSSVLNSHCNRKGKRFIEEFAIPMGCRSVRRRSPYICSYAFGNDWKIFIDNPLGKATEVKEAIRILSQDLTAMRAKATMHTNKHVFLCWILSPKGIMTACAILHYHYNRMNIEMFAVHRRYRKRGLGDIMLYTIQQRMSYISSDCKLYVCAAMSAVPFWSKKRYHFQRACANRLEQYEITDEKKGDVLHLIWIGDPIYAKYQLLKRFLIYEQNLL